MGESIAQPFSWGKFIGGLMVGLAVVTAVSVLVGSARSEINSQVAAASKASFYVQAANTDSGLTPVPSTQLTSPKNSATKRDCGR